MSRLFGVAGVQMSVIPWKPEATMDKMSDIAAQIRRNFPWVQMLIFHELAVSGLVQFASPDNVESWRKHFEPVPGKMTDRLCAIARKNEQWLIPGSLYERDGDQIFNTALVISPQGEIVARYRKMYPWLPYEVGTSAGNEFCVFDIPGFGRFGLFICYDMWFPETSRTLAWMGAEVILQPTLTPTSDRELELVMCRANAIFNQAYFISINGMGEWGGGRSTIIDPDGRVMQEAGTNQTILTEMIDLDHVTRTREYGTIGLAQTLKQLRDAGHSFPIYGNQAVDPQGFNHLGQLGFHKSLNG